MRAPIVTQPDRTGSPSIEAKWKSLSLAPIKIIRPAVCLFVRLLTYSRVRKWILLRNLQELPIRLILVNDHGHRQWKRPVVVKLRLYMALRSCLRPSLPSKILFAGHAMTERYICCKKGIWPVESKKINWILQWTRSRSRLLLQTLLAHLLTGKVLPFGH